MSFEYATTAPENHAELPEKSVSVAATSPPVHDSAVPRVQPFSTSIFPIFGTMLSIMRGVYTDFYAI